MIGIGVALYRRDFPNVKSSATPSSLLLSTSSILFQWLPVLPTTFLIPEMPLWVTTFVSGRPTLCRPSPRQTFALRRSKRYSCIPATSRLAGRRDILIVQLILLQIVDSVMREDTLSGSEYRDVLEIVGLSYNDQLWAYGLSLYWFQQSQRFSNQNLTRDERVLRRMLSMGLYDDKDSMNNLGPRRAMMHGVVMADCLWKTLGTRGQIPSRYIEKTWCSQTQSDYNVPSD